MQVELSKQKIGEIKNKIRKFEAIFSEKRYLESLGPPITIFGRENEAEKIMKFLHPAKDGFSFPFVSVYGKSGTGKSTVVKFICDNMTDVFSYCFVNLRRTDTHFGCANLILESLDGEQVKSSAGINTAINNIEKQIEETLIRDKKSNFILILDEFDVIFSDKRRKGSDFVYKLLTLIETLRSKGYWLCLVAISNSRLADFPLEERIRSRIDECDVYFPPYTSKDVVQILRKRAEKAFVDKVDDDVLRKCANLSSAENGDCRYALQLLLKTAEITNGPISVSDVKNAYSQLKKDYPEEIIKTVTPHQKVILLAMARMRMLYEEEVFSTKEIFNEYGNILHPSKRLEYRRIFDLLNELENLGIIASVKRSEGRYGYHKFYRLLVPHHAVGYMVSKNWDAHQNAIVAEKKSWERAEEEARFEALRQSEKQHQH
ncbi:MAG: ORC1-type DNA replication protein [Nitrosopumilales archaeon]|nr:MAG: ORC1-type DNA replication protein [Nitrosopumilales archaeon]